MEHTRRYEGAPAPVRPRRKANLQRRREYRGLSFVLLPSLIAFPTKLVTNLCLDGHTRTPDRTRAVFLA